MVPSAVVIAAAWVAAATGQSPQAILREAAEAMVSVDTAAYEGREERRAGESWRTVAGRVRLKRFDYSDPLDGRFLVEGEISRAGTADPQPFRLAYDGEVVQRYLPGRARLVQADRDYGGIGLQSGCYGDLVLRDLVRTNPLAAELAAPEATYEGTAEVAGVVCDVVEVELAESRVRWSFGVDDRLPRRRELFFRSARGGDVVSTLTLSDLEINAGMDPGVFTPAAPEDVTVETVGRKPPAPIRVGDPAPAWTLLDDTGRARSLADYRGKVVLMDFWATWCGYCQKAMPAVQRLHDEYASRGLVVLGVNCRDAETVDPVAFVRDRNFTYPVLLGGNAIAPAYQVGGIPAFYLIGADGRMLHWQSGYSSEAEQRLERIIVSNLP